MWPCSNCLISRPQLRHCSRHVGVGDGESIDTVLEITFTNTTNRASSCTVLAARKIGTTEGNFCRLSVGRPSAIFLAFFSSASYNREAKTIPFTPRMIVIFTVCLYYCSCITSNLEEHASLVASRSQSVLAQRPDFPQSFVPEVWSSHEERLASKVTSLAPNDFAYRHGNLFMGRIALPIRKITKCATHTAHTRRRCGDKVNAL